MPSPSRALQFNREAALSSIAETIEDDLYVADLFANEKVQPALYHFIITRRGSSEVIEWGQAFSMDAIRNAAREWMEHSALRIAS